MMTSRRATEADLAMEDLRNEETGILYLIPDQVLPLLVDGPNAALIATFKKGDLLFREGTASTVPIYFILRGEFSVSHKLLGSTEEAESQVFTTDAAPVALGDVEFFVRGVSAEKLGRGLKNKTLSTVVCISEDATVLVLPQPLLFDLIEKGAASQLMYNIARAVSIKLLKRGAESELARMPDRQAIILYLRKRVMEPGAVIRNDPEKANSNLAFQLKEPLGRDDVAAAVGTTDETVRKEIQKIHHENSFYWRRDHLEMSQDFIRVLREHPEHLFYTAPDPKKPQKP